MARDFKRGARFKNKVKQDPSNLTHSIPQHANRAAPVVTLPSVVPPGINVDDVDFLKDREMTETQTTTSDERHEQHESSALTADGIRRYVCSWTYLYYLV
ncbi:MAG: hypothetical protein L0K77_09050 [Bifidobacterium crudilactis]|uniref:hypothetical protein n=1 Tax=Bifidobacterium crudilactis TaxID=327277 RepID=UPI0026470089|nr:hypothetical protein [Bifidobacterium crudilactis]MDN6210163.1 hypothetical protein [Bifidobacterium crudilactis]MDN6559515.1 hypothetical protein [Bifidobacterium crudilactis]MDN6587445.1 hypothetical protein [Bifidobacterium crudilactis]MDN6654709.1 hypothetical protein [Bifidobacterium crudilactis]MDN6772479.1 hypothetical protein [Bifidobacterium crudilactis]